MKRLISRKYYSIKFSLIFRANICLLFHRNNNNENKNHETNGKRVTIQTQNWGVPCNNFFNLAQEEKLHV